MIADKHESKDEKAGIKTNGKQDHKSHAEANTKQH